MCHGRNEVIKTGSLNLGSKGMRFHAHILVDHDTEEGAAFLLLSMFTQSETPVHRMVLLTISVVLPVSVNALEMTLQTHSELDLYVILNLVKLDSED